MAAERGNRLATTQTGGGNKRQSAAAGWRLFPSPMLPPTYPLAGMLLGSTFDTRHYGGKEEETPGVREDGEAAKDQIQISLRGPGGIISSCLS
ncbi:unnamed protein product [Protopolystoma xenopodis]|uniref:Uncharacterized protein n=1 Tax=Protopolystoma xenopodis TaxID=117903 RepID=A0A448X9E8_9PLAT|nr:unnamed protein product [Protopolystoma xenopodis]